MVNGNPTVSANISMYSVYRVYSVNSSYSVYSVVYSVLLINSANTLDYSAYSDLLNCSYSVYSVCIVRYSDLFKLVYSVLLFINSISRLLGELNGIELDIVNESTGWIEINSTKG